MRMMRAKGTMLGAAIAALACLPVMGQTVGEVSQTNQSASVTLTDNTWTLLLTNSPSGKVALDVLVQWVSGDTVLVAFGDTNGTPKRVSASMPATGLGPLTPYYGPVWAKLPGTANFTNSVVTGFRNLKK